MKILRISCSPRGHDSESFKLAETIVHYLMKRHPEAEVISRELAAGTISHVDAEYAGVLGGLRPISDGDRLAGSLFESERLIKELEDSDYLVLGTPMHNFTVPSALKAWIDHVVRVYRTFRPTPQGKVGSLKDRPVFVAVSSGGTYSGEVPLQPDFLTPYLTTVLNTIGLWDVTFFSIQGAAFGADALASAWKIAEQELAHYFSTPVMQD